MPLHLTCDDVGLSPAVNRAALAVCQRYAPRYAVSASVVANFPAYADALTVFAEAATPARLGAHLNLSEGRPLTGPHPALTAPNGQFWPIRTLAARAVRGHATFLQRAEDELAAQIHRLRADGVDIEHITTHMHFHVLPVFGAMIARFARRHKVAWVRATAASATLLPLNPLPRWFAPSGDGVVLAALAPIMYWLTQPPAQLRHQLAPLATDGRATVEVVLHPDARHDPDFPPHIAYGPRPRAAEVDYLHQVLGE
jgi:predicted glycoside hydrolase/deacetylase ChbG (UPF0249 family)